MRLEHCCLLFIVAAGLYGCQKRTPKVCSTNQDCAAGLTCYHSSCLDPCATQNACEREGKCTTKAGKCVVASNTDCERSELCNGSVGFCHAIDGRCAPKTDADCKASKGCRILGQCSVSDLACVAQNDQDCIDSAACGDAQLSASNRLCMLSEPLKRCVSCEETEACLNDGLCGVQLRGSIAKCVSCDVSDVCLGGYCSLKNGRCTNDRGRPYAGQRSLADVRDPRKLNDRRRTTRDEVRGPSEPVKPRPEGHSKPQDSLMPPGTAAVDTSMQRVHSDREHARNIPPAHAHAEGQKTPDGFWSHGGKPGTDAQRAKSQKTQPLDEPIMKDGRADAMSFGESSGGAKQAAPKPGGAGGDTLMPPGTEAY
ncbi:MAG: hypothetical protein VYA30_07915 [Myxococcota bacterium]|nr:hypothetical protein [Myxococcota bacterium]